MYVDEKGRVCKQSSGNELEFYKRCMNETKLKPFLDAIPELQDWFKLREGIDKIEFNLDGENVKEEDLAAAEQQDLQGRCTKHNC